MHLWKIQNGIPSLADNFLVAGCMSVGIGCFVSALDPTLEFFESHGFAYLGYFVLFIPFGALGGLGLWLFIRNERNLRAEVIIPRRVYGFGVTTVLIINTTFVIMRAFQLDLLTTGLAVTLLFTIVYGFVIQAALRWPSVTTSVSVWLCLTLSALGVLAKAFKLFSAK